MKSINGSNTFDVLRDNKERDVEIWNMVDDDKKAVLPQGEYNKAYGFLKQHEENLDISDKKREEHLKHNQEILEKYQGLPVVHDNAFTWVPKGWLYGVDRIGHISAKAYGLLVLIHSISSPIPLYGGKYGTHLDVLGTRRLLKLKNANSNKEIKDLLEQLLAHNLIKIDGEFILLGHTGKTTDYTDFGFCKLYTTTIFDIIESFKGLSILKHLATYLAWRSLVYETISDIPVTEMDTDIASRYVNLSKRMYHDYLRDLLNRDILLHYTYVDALGMQHPHKFMIAEKLNHKDLDQCLIDGCVENQKVLRLVE